MSHCGFNPFVNNLTHWCAIELYFDESMQNQVLKTWDALSLRSNTSQLTEIGSRPHITLWSSSSQNLNPLKLKALIKEFASKQEPLNLSLSSIGYVTGAESSTMFFAPTPTLSLLKLHSLLCDLLGYEEIEIKDEFKVDSWMPFCVVGQDIPRSRLPEAYGVLREVKLPITGSAIDVGLVEFSPVRELCSYKLSRSAELRYP